MSTSSSDSGEPPSKINFIPDPCFVIDSPEHSIPCRGCHRLFSCLVENSVKFPSPEFFDHCVSKCSKYSKLQLIRECDHCWSVFVDETLYNSHVSLCPVIAERNFNLHKIKNTFLDYSQDCKARDLSKGIEETGVETNQVCGNDSGDESDLKETNQLCGNDSGDESDLELTVKKEAWVLHVPEQSLECKKFGERIPCLGCGKKYPGSKIIEKVIQEDGSEVEEETIIGRRDFYNHCIFKCPKYQNLNLVSLCLRCNKFFLDPDEFVTHKLSSCNIEDEPEERNPCPCCHKSFSGLKSLKQHITRSHDLNGIDVKFLEVLKMDSRIVCELCRKVFFSVNGLRSHQTTHSIPAVSDLDIQPLTSSSVVRTGEKLKENGERSREKVHSTSSSVVKMEEKYEDNDERIMERVEQEETEMMQDLKERSEKHEGGKSRNVGRIPAVLKQPLSYAREEKRLNHGCDLCTKSFGDKRRLTLHKRCHEKKSAESSAKRSNRNVHRIKEGRESSARSTRSVHRKCDEKK